MRFTTGHFINRVRGLAFGVSFGVVAAIFAAPLAAQNSGPLDQVSIKESPTKGKFVGALDRVSEPIRPQSRLQAEHTFKKVQHANGVSSHKPIAAQVAYVPRALSMLPQQAFEPQVNETFERPQYESADVTYDRPQLDHATADHGQGIANGPVIVPEAFPTTDRQAKATPILKAVTRESIGSGVQEENWHQAPEVAIQSVVPESTMGQSSASFRGIGYAPAGQQIDPESRQDILEMETAAQLAAQQANDQIHQQYSQGVGEFGDGHGHGDPSFGYVDGAAFGHNQNRLYHPLEGPTTRLNGTPTVASNFGIGCYCDEWDNFCQCQPGMTPCGCGGLKSTPGHLGLRWLGSNDNCDQTERPSCRCRKCQTKKCCD